MTQLFGSPTLDKGEKMDKMERERRTVSGLSITSRHTTGSKDIPQRIRNFFRINSTSSSGAVSPKQDRSISGFRQSRFLSSMSRNRSHTIVSEGDPLDNGMSPTAVANPYFAHQGPPALRHHNEGSVPPSPPDTPGIKIEVVSGPTDQPSKGREELARKLRRVASAPNAQGLFKSSKTDPPRSPAPTQEAAPAVENDHLLPLPVGDGKLPTPGQIRKSIAFRRTYSSNSIKVREVEVGPGSFDKIKLIGKGDVGKVYLVREKRSNRLYAMKGTRLDVREKLMGSTEQKRNDQTQQNQTSVSRARNLSNQQSPFYRDIVSFVPIRGSSVSLHGIL